MRRLRAGGRRSLTHSGGLGSPSGPTTGVCHSCWLDVALVNGGKPSGSAECGALRLCPEERSRGQKSPIAVADCVNLSAVWRAVRRCAVAACRRSGGADRDRNHPLRLTARCHPSSFEGDCSHLGRASAARMRERGCLICESGEATTPSPRAHSRPPRGCRRYWPCSFPPCRP
jgi:hypothetical protein